MNYIWCVTIQTDSQIACDAAFTSRAKAEKYIEKNDKGDYEESGACYYLSLVKINQEIKNLD